MKKGRLWAAILLCLLLLTSCSEKEGEEMNTKFELFATVEEVVEHHIEVEIYDSDYAFGTYWVLTGKETEYFDRDGNTITRDDLKSGDKIKISYGGQVMMSMPPQIVAGKIEVLK
jgi:hypothetical protein